MNASAQFTTDAAIAAKWAAAQDDGNAPALTVAELDHLIALTPANDARALADLADARAIEVELSGAATTCHTCRGAGYITREIVTGSPAAWYGYEVDYIDVTCPDCGADDREPAHYSDDDMDALFAQVCRDAAVAVTA